MFPFLPFKFRVAVSVVAELLYAGVAYAQGGYTITVEPPERFRDLVSLANAVGGYAFAIAIPIAAAVIIYAGVKFVTARGNTSQIDEAKRMLWYAVVAIAIIVIGSGFFDLIKSILGI